MQPTSVIIRNVGLAIRKTLIRRFLWTNHINITVNIIQTIVIPRNVLLKHIRLCNRYENYLFIFIFILLVHLCIHINRAIQLPGPLHTSHPSQHLRHEYLCSISLDEATKKNKTVDSRLVQGWQNLSSFQHIDCRCIKKYIK